MRRWIISATAVMIAGAFACVEIVGVHDLSCSAPEGGPFDTCTGEGGVTMLPTNGELRGLAWANGVIVAVGYDDLDGSTALSIRVVSPTGDVLDQIVEDAGVATAVSADPAQTGVWISGSDGAHFMARHGALAPLKLDVKANFAQTKDTVVTLRDSVAIAVGGDQTIFGTSTADDLVALRINSSGGYVHDAVFSNAKAFRATDGVTGGTSLTILGDTPDAALGLAMVRWQNGTAPSGGPGLDKTFNDGGSLVMSFGDGGSARSLVLGADSSYWVGGVAVGDAGFVLAHVTSSGALDQSWTAPGPNRGTNAILAIDGGVLAAGYADGKLALARFTLDAGIDPTFGDAGVVELALPGELRAIVQTDDRYVAGGYTTVNGMKQWVLVWLLP